MSEPCKVGVRNIEKSDLEQLVEAERLWHTVKYDDPDFGELEVVNDYALGEAELLEVVRQYQSKKKGQFNSHVLVCETVVEVVSENDGPGDDTGGEAGDAVVTADWVCGGFAYEAHPLGFDVNFLVLHPACSVDDTVTAIAAHLKTKADKHPTRKKVTIHLRDRDEAGLRSLLPALVKHGFAVRLRPNYFGFDDGWELTYESDEVERRSDEKGTAACA